MNQNPIMLFGGKLVHMHIFVSDTMIISSSLNYAVRHNKRL